MHEAHSWWTTIAGAEAWFSQFAARFSHREFEVDHVSWEVSGAHENGWALATARLDGCDDLAEARLAAEAEVRVLSGLARLLWEGIPPVRPVLLIRVDNKEFVEGAILAVPGIAIVRGRTPMDVEGRILTSDKPSGRLRDDVIGRLKSERLSRALELYGREQPNWGSLYKVYELLRERFTDYGIASTGLASKQDLARFRATANLPDLSGIDARHAAGSRDAPMAMELREAHAMVRNLLASWLGGAIGGDSQAQKGT
jgi:hypothetical protein